MSSMDVMPISLERQESSASTHISDGILTPRFFDATTISHAMADNASTPRDRAKSDDTNSDSEFVEESNSSAAESAESESPAPAPQTRGIGKVRKLANLFEQLGSPTAPTQSFEAQESKVETLSTSTVEASATVQQIQGYYRNAQSAELHFPAAPVNGKLTGTLAPNEAVEFPGAPASAIFDVVGIQDLTAAEPAFSLSSTYTNANVAISMVGVVDQYGNLHMKIMLSNSTTVYEKIYYVF